VKVVEICKKVLTVLSVVGLIALLDQLTKFVALRELAFNSPVTIVENVFFLRLVKNPGAAFSMFADLPSPYRQLCLGLTSLVALWFLVHMLLTEAKDDVLLRLSLSLVLGGAIGNLIDRVRFGAVVDFLEVYIGSYPWPVFNIADSAISLGVALLLLSMWRKKRPAPLVEVKA